MSELATYIRSASELQPNFTYALPYESRRLHEQVQGIRDKRHILSGHISDAMEQSSETWHDNAPADALFGEMYQLDSRESSLAVAARFLIKVPYPTAEIGFVTIGTRVECEMAGEVFKIDITGNAPLSRDEEDHDEVERGSIDAPMPRGLLGALPNTEFVLDINGRTLEIGIVGIDQDAQRLAYEV